MPAMFTPRSRARFRMNSSRSRSSSVYSRVLPSLRLGSSSPSRSYSRSVCGWMSYISATAEIMYAPLLLRFVAIAGLACLLEFLYALRRFDQQPQRLVHRLSIGKDSGNIGLRNYDRRSLRLSIDNDLNALGI